MYKILQTVDNSLYKFLELDFGSSINFPLFLFIPVAVLRLIAILHMVCSSPEESVHDIVDLPASKQYLYFLNKMLIETKHPSSYPRWDVCRRAVAVAFVLPAMQMEDLALSSGEEPHTKACWEENACSFTPSWLGILPSDWLCVRSSHSPPSAGFLPFHETRNIWKQLQCETTGSGWRWHEFRSGFVIATTSHEVPRVLNAVSRFKQ